MMTFGKYRQKEKYVATILQALRNQGWICPEYEQGRKTRAMGEHNIPEFFGTIAQKGDWSFVLWNHSPYAKEFAVPRGKNWALFYKDRVMDAGRKLKPPGGVVARVVKTASMPIERLVAVILASS